MINLKIKLNTPFPGPDFNIQKKVTNLGKVDMEMMT